MIAIPLNKGQVAIVDDIDSDLAKLTWFSDNCGNRRKVTYAIRHQSGKCVSMHRVILQRIIGRSIKSNEMTDHINSNGLDNRRSNLRIASPTQNHCNRRKLQSLQGHPTSSKYKGVRWEEDRKRWRVDIRIAGKKKFLGRFVSETEAALAYDRAAESAFGEYARINDPRRTNNKIASGLES